MAFASADQAKQAITAGRAQRWIFDKAGTNIPEAAGQIVTFANEAGTPGAMADPSTYANCTSLDGTMTFTNVSPGNRYLVGGSLTATQDGTIIIYDRLGHIGAISLASTGNKTVSSSALPRSMSTNDLANVEAWLELTTATTTTAPIVSMNSYTNEAGTAARAGGSLTFPATATNVRWMGKLPLQAGDKGVQAVSTINVATAASAGVANVVLLRQIAQVGVYANVATPFAPDHIDDMPRVYDGSSLCIMFMASSAAALNIRGRLVFAYDA